MSRDEMRRLGWSECDVIIVTGDAYVDHPAFGSAVIARVLLAAGFRTGIIAQPRWDSAEDFTRLGRPRLFFGVTAGNVDSLVAHYSPLGQRRRTDAYSPGGKPGLRPNRASIIYCNRLREAYPDAVLVLGGIEASLRRLAHYDYWDNRIRRSLLLDAKADILTYGMAETQIVEIARRINARTGSPPRHQDTTKQSKGLTGSLDGIPGTVVVRSVLPQLEHALEIPSYEDILTDRSRFQQAFMLWYQESDQPFGQTIIQKSGDRYIIHYPPARPLTTPELDQIYDLPYRRAPHPHYSEPVYHQDTKTPGIEARNSPIPALETVKFSITSHRGCLGRCTFCSLAAHQGRVIQWRSPDSIVAEAKRIAELPGFKGHITDVGGPTANMYGATCARLARAEPCRNQDCLYPQPCPKLKSDLTRQLSVLDAVRQVPGVRKVSLGTGLRYDLLADDAALEELCRHYVSGQLRVAPEHVSPRVLRLMRKAPAEAYTAFRPVYAEVNQRLGRRQYLIPYFISGFPGCTLEDMVELAEHIERNEHFLVRQVQDFTPLPMTLAATMYYTGIDPFTGEPLDVARDVKVKKLQRALLQLRVPENLAYVTRVLRATGQHRLLKRIQRIHHQDTKTPGSKGEDSSPVAARS
jgi:uncharacterized radical SAM protein YgiQ